ncbi:hypothetical protein AURDEDRAFT_168519 [Auricularia subglabra TFB-10046 SS5]|nr:hypothetical protein AURDEDRAFT_168519 [Auricularia subglabra TFB-10046 SS5]
MFKTPIPGHSELPALVEAHPEHFADWCYAFLSPIGSTSEEYTVLYEETADGRFIVIGWIPLFIAEPIWRRWVDLRYGDNPPRYKLQKKPAFYVPPGPPPLQAITNANFTAAGPSAPRRTGREVATPSSSRAGPSGSQNTRPLAGRPKSRAAPGGTTVQTPASQPSTTLETTGSIPSSAPIPRAHTIPTSQHASASATTGAARKSRAPVSNTITPMLVLEALGPRPNVKRPRDEPEDPTEGLRPAKRARPDDADSAANDAALFAEILNEEAFGDAA